MSKWLCFYHPTYWCKAPDSNNLIPNMNDNEIYINILLRNFTPRQKGWQLQIQDELNNSNIKGDYKRKHLNKHHLQLDKRKPQEITPVILQCFCSSYYSIIFKMILIIRSKGSISKNQKQHQKKKKLTGFTKRSSLKCLYWDLFLASSDGQSPRSGGK